MSTIPVIMKTMSAIAIRHSDFDSLFNLTRSEPTRFYPSKLGHKLIHALQFTRTKPSRKEPSKWNSSAGSVNSLELRKRSRRASSAMSLFTAGVAWAKASSSSKLSPICRTTQRSTTSAAKPPRRTTLKAFPPLPLKRWAFRRSLSRASASSSNFCLPRPRTRTSYSFSTNTLT